MGKIPLVVLVSSILGIVSVGHADERIDEYLKLRRMIGKEHFEEALVRCQELIERYPEYLFLYDAIAEVSFNLGKTKHTNLYLEDLSRNGPQPALAEYGLGSLFLMSRDYTQAEYFFSKALDHGAPKAESAKGLAYSLEGARGFQGAIATLSQLSLRFPDNGAYQYALALEYWRRKDFAKAKQHIYNALGTDRLEPKYLEAQGVLDLIDAESVNGNPALRHLASIARERADLGAAQFLESHILMNMLGPSDRYALRQRLRELLQESKDYGLFRWVGWGNKILADINYFDGHYRDALRASLEAYSASERANDQELQIGILVREFESFLELGDYESALLTAQKRVQYCRNVGGEDEFLRALNDLSWAYRQLGRYSIALEYAAEALSRVESAGLHARFLYQVETNLGLIHMGMGKQRSALQYFYSAREHVPRTRMRSLLLAVISGNVGEAYLHLGEFASAERSFSEQLRLGRRFGYTREETNAYLNYGKLWLAKKQALRASRYFSMARRLAVRERNIPSEISAERGIARAYRERGFFNEAIPHLRRSIILQGRIHQSYHVANSELSQDCRNLAQLLAEVGEVDEAFAMAEVSKLIALRDRRIFSVKHLKQTLPSGSFARAACLRSQMEERTRELIPLILASRHWENNGRKDLDAMEKLTKLEYEYFALLDSLGISRKDSSFQSPTFVTPLERFRKAVLGDSVALVEYLVGETHSNVFFLSNRSLTQFKIPVEKEKLEDILKRLSILTDPGFEGELILRPELARFDQIASTTLSHILIGPIIDSLRGLNRLIVIPDGNLSRLPFEALPTLRPPIRGENVVNSPRLIIDEVEVSYGIAARLILDATETVVQPEKVFLGVGNPTAPRTGHRQMSSEAVMLNKPFTPVAAIALPGSEAEVRGAAEILGPASTCLIGERATRKAIRRIAGEYGIIHFATHSKHIKDWPMWSGLLLSSDENGEDYDIMQAGEFFGLDLEAELVVLSSCNTGKDGNSGGNFGLIRALRFSGIPSVIGSLWTVSDYDSPQLMQSFYRHLQNGNRKSSALRLAKLEMIRSGKTDPIYWAGYVLVGQDSPVQCALPGTARRESAASIFTIISVASLLWAMSVRAAILFYGFKERPIVFKD